MRGVFLVLLICMCSTVGFGQSMTKPQLKLDKAFQKSPEKCLKKAKKIAHKDGRSALAHYYIAQCTFVRYSRVKNSGQLNRCVKSLIKYRKYDKGQVVVDDQFLSAVAEAYGEMVVADYNQGKKGRAKKEAKTYATAFNESLTEYDLLISEEFVVKRKEDSEEVAAVKEKVPIEAKDAPVSDSKTVSYLNEIEEFSTPFIGTAYKFGGESPNGFDCSGFTKFVYGKMGVALPHSSFEQSKMGSRVKMTESKPGDLIFFGTKKGKSYKCTHVAIIYTNTEGKIKMIHAANSGVRFDEEGGVSFEHYWRQRILFVKRL